MNFATIKAFVKKHTQSPEEYITEFDVEEMNEWLHAKHESSLAKINSMGIQLRYEKGADTTTEYGRSTNNFWIVLSSEKGQFAMRKFAEGAEEAKRLAAYAFATSKKYSETLELVDGIYPAHESFLEDSYLRFTDWIVDTTGPSMDWSKNAPSSIYSWSGHLLGLAGSGALAHIKEVCRQKLSLATFMEKTFLLENMKNKTNALVEVKFLKNVVDEDGNDENLVDVAGLSVGGNFRVIPIEAKDSTLEAWILIRPDGYDWSPILKDANVQISTYKYTIRNTYCEFGADTYWQDEFKVYQFTDDDLGLPASSIDTMIALGQTPFEMLQYALSATKTQESYSMDFTMADQANESGLSL